MDKRLQLSILDYLDSVKNQTKNSSLMDRVIAMLQCCLSSSLTTRTEFELNRTDMQTRSQYGVNDSLSSIFNYVRLCFYSNVKYMESHKSAEEPSELSPELQSFVNKLSQRGYFQSFSPDSAEYKVRFVRYIECRRCCRRRSTSTCSARTASRRSTLRRITSTRARRSRRKGTSISAPGTSRRRLRTTRKR